MGNIQLFNYGEQEVRVILINGEPWWVAKDICASLLIKNSSQALTRLNKNEKSMALVDTPGGPQEVAIVNESGLYSLIFSSRKKEAKIFTQWVTRDVLPIIRENGAYFVDVPKELQEKIINDPFIQLRIENIKLENRVANLEEETKGLKKTTNTIKETIVQTTAVDVWREYIDKTFKELGKTTGNYKTIRQESYELLNERARVNVYRRRTNKQNRLRKAGFRESDINRVAIIDVIQEDPKLREIYETITKELYIKHVA